jgi:hypothetical protein
VFNGINPAGDWMDLNKRVGFRKIMKSREKNVHS